MDLPGKMGDLKQESERFQYSKNGSDFYYVNQNRLFPVLFSVTGWSQSSLFLKSRIEG